MTSGGPRTFPQTFLGPMPGACEVVLVRHGQSQAHVEGVPFPLVDGHGDPPLSPLGERQAEAVGARLGGLPVAAIWVSTLTRTHQTAAPLARVLGLRPQVDPDLREVFLGDYEGGELRVRSADGDPAVLELRRTGEWGSIPNAETNEQLRLRTTAAVQRIADAHPDQLVVVVCHGGVIAALLGHAAGTEGRVFMGARNGSVNHLHVRGDQWRIRTFNDASHIGSLQADDPMGITDAEAAASGGDQSV